MASALSSSIGVTLNVSPKKPGPPPLTTLPTQFPLLAFPGIRGVPSMARTGGVKVVMSASQQKGLDISMPTAMALMAAMAVPEIAEAAQAGVSPSLNNLLLSVVYGGVIALIIGGAVAGVSVFDPVKRK